MVLSDQEFVDYGGFKAPKTQVEPPAPYNKNTRTSFGRATTWSRQPGMGISKQASGSFLSFDDDAGTPLPESDRGSSFGKA